MEENSEEGKECAYCNKTIFYKMEHHENFYCKERIAPIYEFYEICEIGFEDKKDLKSHKKVIHGIAQSRDGTPVKSQTSQATIMESPPSDNGNSENSSSRNEQPLSIRPGSNNEKVVKRETVCSYNQLQVLS